MRARAAALTLLIALAAHGAAQPPLCDFAGAGNDVATCEVLQALYDSTGGDNWLDNGGWVDAFSAASAGGAPADYCTFTGVTCDGNNEFVLGLDLGFVGLAGTLPPALGLLENVTDLRLDVNALSGTIPNELTSLTNLELLVLVGNRLSGSLPDALGSLSALTLLRVDNNVLEGSLPASVGSLTSLLLLGLDNNRIAGSLPAEIGALTALQSLSAAGNALQGTLPAAALAELTALTYMSLAKNVLSGELPETLGDLTGLTLLSLENNALRGSLPSDALGALTALQYLGLQGNKLNGTLPDALGSLTALQELTLRENAFSGSLPAALGALTQLTYLWLDTNSFSGVLPGAALGNLSARTVLTLDSNDLVGKLPLELGTLPQLQRLSASNNLLNGSLPDAFSNLTSLRLLSMGGNAGLGGGLPLSWAALSSLTALDLSDCAFSGTVPPQWETGMAALRVLKLSGNAGLGPAPGVLATLPTSPCGSVAEAYDPVRGCVCAPGYSLAAGRECLPCAPGTYAAAVGAAACVACPANTYAAPDATSCIACPSGASSPPGSAVLQNCACLYGTYAVPSADGATFACESCPANAICTGPDVPLAQTGYWHIPGDHSVFYACAEDKCLAETPGEAAANSSNCVIGRTGNVCGICEEDWAEQDQVCVPCRPSDAFDAWSDSSKAGAIIGALLLFVGVSYVGFLRPLFGGQDAHNADTSKRSAGHAALAHVTLLSAVLEMVSEPLTIVVESLQIVSSFQRTMHINWPPLDFHIMAKLNIVNFSFLRFPNTACATPAVSFYQELCACLACYLHCIALSSACSQEWHHHRRERCAALDCIPLAGREHLRAPPRPARGDAAALQWRCHGAHLRVPQHRVRAGERGGDGGLCVPQAGRRVMAVPRRRHAVLHGRAPHVREAGHILGCLLRHRHPSLLHWPPLLFPYSGHCDAAAPYCHAARCHRARLVARRGPAGRREHQPGDRGKHQRGAPGRAVCWFASRQKAQIVFAPQICVGGGTHAPSAGPGSLASAGQNQRPRGGGGGGGSG